MEGLDPFPSLDSNDIQKAMRQFCQLLTAHPTSTSHPSELADEELRSKILRQVEFYFSDANLPTDDFLLNILRRPGPGGSSEKQQQGWVPIKTLASFHKMKKLTNNISTIVAALRTSTVLEVSPEGQRVRRLAPFDVNINFDDIRLKTVITWNLPEKPTIEYVIDLFSSIGEVEIARIRKTDHPEPLLTRGLKADIKKNVRDFYALIRYTTREEAVKAVEKLHDESNWRSGLRVKLLVPIEEETTNRKSHVSSGVTAAADKGGERGKRKERRKEAMARDTAKVAAAEGEGGGVREETPSAEGVHLQERPKPAWARSVQSSLWGNIEKEISQKDKKLSSATNEGNFNRGENDGGGGYSTPHVGSDRIDTVANPTTTRSSIGASMAVKGGQPKMPDAEKRGFGVGRGNVPSEDSLIKLLNSSLGGNSDAAAPGSVVVDGKGEGYY